MRVISLKLVIRDLGLRKPIYRKTTTYGDFSCDDIEFPRERTDKAESLKSRVVVH